jgi:hypothetical protein
MLDTEATLVKPALGAASVFDGDRESCNTIDKGFSFENPCGIWESGARSFVDY